MTVSHKKIFNLACLLLLFSQYLPVCIFGQSAGRSDKNPDWKDLSQYFKPPAEYEGKTGDYRSPLQFSDGRFVRNGKEWKTRRKEIMSYWTGKLGTWPAYIKRQKIEYLDTLERDENLTQYRIRFSWLPGQKTEAYLLVPNIPGKKPAVITVFYEPETAAGIGGKELHALMAPRPFLVSGGSEDNPERWIPLNLSVAVNRLLGFENRVAMTNRPEHSPNAESNEQIYKFFEYYLMTPRE